MKKKNILAAAALLSCCAWAGADGRQSGGMSPATPATAEEAAPVLDGVFTVCSSPLKKVRFTRGNLMALVSADGTAVKEWKLADRQYDCVGDTEAQRQCRDGWVDLFCWTPEGLYSDIRQYGINTSTEDGDYTRSGGSDTPCDWGSLAGKGLTVLSDGEWRYLMSHAAAANSSRRHEFTIAGTSCAILLPDGFSGNVQDSYTADEWADAEKAGLVALPYTGGRYGTAVIGMGCYTYCLTSKGGDSGYLPVAFAGPERTEVRDGRRSFAFPVRPVSEL